MFKYLAYEQQVESLRHFNLDRSDYGVYDRGVSNLVCHREDRKKNYLFCLSQPSSEAAWKKEE